MKTIVAGSRDINSPKMVKEAIEACDWEITEIVSGTARGVDRMGELVAKSKGIPVKQFPANWDAFGRRAGIVRNTEMARYADCLCAIWNGHSPGTKHMIDEAYRQGLKVHVLLVKDVPSLTGSFL